MFENRWLVTYSIAEPEDGFVTLTSKLNIDSREQVALYTATTAVRGGRRVLKHSGHRVYIDLVNARTSVLRRIFRHNYCKLPSDRMTDNVCILLREIFAAAMSRDASELDKVRTKWVNEAERDVVDLIDNLKQVLVSPEATILPGLQAMAIIEESGHASIAVEANSLIQFATLQLALDLRAAREYRTCPVCGDYLQIIDWAGRRPKYCSDVCKHRAWRKSAAKKSASGEEGLE